MNQSFKVYKRPSPETLFQRRQYLQQCLTGFRRLPNVGVEGGSDQYIVVKKVFPLFDIIDPVSRKNIHSGWIGHTDLCGAVVVCFKGKLHVPFIIGILLYIGCIMYAKKFPNREVFIFLPVFIEMSNKSGEFEQLAQLCCGKQVNGKKKYGGNFFQQREGTNIILIDITAMKWQDKKIPAEAGRVFSR
jgi:hypothetical protein